MTLSFFFEIGIFVTYRISHGIYSHGSGGRNALCFILSKIDVGQNEMEFVTKLPLFLICVEVYNCVLNFAITVFCCFGFTSKLKIDVFKSFSALDM